jgi:formate--tetrahydrofolate ligase
LEPAKDKLKFIASHGYQNLPVVISKTQYSFSEDENALSAPENFELTIRDIELKSGAGFVLALCGKQLLMPALPKEPNATKVVLKGKTIQKLQ